MRHYTNTRNPVNFPQFTVICSECSEEHLTTEVECVNVEEDMHGRDVMHFVCPVTKTATKSLVYGR